MEQSNDTKIQLKQAIADYCNIKQISRNEVAKLAGVNPAIVSKIMNDNWVNISEKKIRLLASFVNVSTQLGEIYSTRDSRSVVQLCTVTQERHLMSGLTADTGMGKTTCIKAYSLRPNVFYYYMDGTITPKIFLKDLLRQTGSEFEGSIYEMLHTLCNRLNSIENPLILIDECAKMSDKLLFTIHSLRDKTLKGCGIVLAGMPDFKKKLAKFAAKGKTGYGEFFRRINYWQELEGLSTKEINAVLIKNGIEDMETQKDFRHLKRFGDLMNEINVFHLENELETA